MLVLLAYFTCLTIGCLNVTGIFYWQAHSRTVSNYDFGNMETLNKEVNHNILTILII